MGSLEPGSVVLNLTNAAPSATVVLFLSLAQGSAPFKGGVLVTVPVAAIIAIATPGSGDLQSAPGRTGRLCPAPPRWCSRVPSMTPPR